MADQPKAPVALVATLRGVFAECREQLGRTFMHFFCHGCQRAQQSLCSDRGAYPKLRSS